MRRFGVVWLVFLFFHPVQSSVPELTFTLNRLIYIDTPLDIPIVFYEVHTLGLDVELTPEALSYQALCTPGDCLEGALDAGAVYQKAFDKEGYEEVIVYYDETGQVVGYAALEDTYEPSGDIGFNPPWPTHTAPV